MADANASNQRTSQGRAGAARDLVVEGLPPCTITPTADGIWQVTTQLVADEQAALAAAAPSPAALCQRAQHALGSAGIGSRIAPDQGAIGIYAAPIPSQSGVITLVLEGRALLWWVSRASSGAIQALIAAAIGVMRATCDA